MAKSKALFVALIGSVVGILGYFLPWITVNIFTERSISGFSLLGMLFGAGNGNVFQALGYSDYLIVLAILLVLALIALLFTGVFSALILRNDNVNKTSGIILTIVSGIVFLIVAGIALLVSIAIREQVGSYVDVGSYIRYGIGFFITCLGTSAVIVSGILLFREGVRIESDGTQHFTQSQMAPLLGSNGSEADNSQRLSPDTLSPFLGSGLTLPAQGIVQGQTAVWDQTQIQPAQLPSQQPISENQGQAWQLPQSQGYANPSAPQFPQQLPYRQPPQQKGQSVQNQGWDVPQKPTLPAQTPFQPPAVGKPPQSRQVNQNKDKNQQQIQSAQNLPFKSPQPWSGNQQPGSNHFGQQQPQFGQNHSQAASPLIQSNRQRPQDKPWEKVRYSGPSQAPQKPQIPPVLPLQNPGQGRVWDQSPTPPSVIQEESHTRGEYLSSLEDPEITRYDSDPRNEILNDENNEFGT